MLSTLHKFFFKDSRKLDFIDDESIDLVVTSPPYPMIEMWDDIFSKLNGGIEESLNLLEGDKAFELMHQELDKTWFELFRILKESAFACINIGDATRTIGKKFQLYSNHSRIISCFKKAGFDTLPVILWRKQTNAPNKFMGSGMLPSGAYVTLEHEYILIFRKGSKRNFIKSEEKLHRQKSSFFWEERNKWFSDIWIDLKGINQKLNHKELRNRSGAFPFELAYRLINMYSVKGDTVFDPFLGTGTTSFAAIASCRNSIGVELDISFNDFIFDDCINFMPLYNNRISQRFIDHFSFVQEYLNTKGELKYTSKNYDFPVMTKQELEILFNYVEKVERSNRDFIKAEYVEEPIIKNITKFEPSKRNSTKKYQQIELVL